MKEDFLFTFNTDGSNFRSLESVKWLMYVYVLEGNHDIKAHKKHDLGVEIESKRY